MITVQEVVHQVSSGTVARVIKLAGAILAVIAMAGLYDTFSYQNYSSGEAMDQSQLARNISEGKGFITDSIRPLTLYLMVGAAEAGQSSQVLSKPVPDLSNAPAYPFLLAGLMKILPFQFEANQRWSYQPERWIAAFNQALLLTAILLVFLLARWLFDEKVAWLAAILFAGTELFWRFSVSGLSTILVINVFLGLTWLLAAMERRDRETPPGEKIRTVPLALAAGVLAGIGMLSRYSFGWLMVPAMAFVLVNLKNSRTKSSIAMAFAFVIVVAPWVARNMALGGHPFGDAQYAICSGTPEFPGDALERSANPREGLGQIVALDIASKLTRNARDIFLNELTRFGGNWISAFFLAGLVIPYRNAGLNRLRGFLMGAIFIFIAAEALGRTGITRESPVINSENLLVLLSPLAFIFGASFVLTLIAQLDFTPVDTSGSAVTILIVLLSAPFVLTLMTPIPSAPYSAYAPLHIKQLAGLMQPGENMTSDIPSAVAWYGERSCVWLPLDDGNEFYKVNALKRIKALFLTQVTTDQGFLSTMKEDPLSWGNFILQCSEHGEVPTGFPLRKAPTGLLPDQLFLSDKARWRETQTKP